MLDGVSLTIGPGEGVGLVGRNGCGKSTLLRILAGVEEADGGTASVGRGLSVGYLPQLPDFPPALPILDAATAGLPPDVPLWQVRKTLSGLGFDEGPLRQRAGTLSGGEKTRLMLARLLVARHDLLVLDELTNHLDIVTRERLEDALAACDGTLLVVSHDRYLLDRLAERLPVVGGGRVTDCPGNYSAWVEERQVTGP